jgi:hypothetical protein
LNGVFLIATIHIESHYLSVLPPITERLFTKSRSLLLQFAVLQKMHSLSPYRVVFPRQYGDRISAGQPVKTRATHTSKPVEAPPI